MKPIWKDYDVNVMFLGHANYTLYKDSVAISSGSVDGFPGRDAHLFPNRIVQNLLRVDFPTQSGVTQHPEAYGRFGFMGDGEPLDVNYWIYDWSYEDVEYGANILSKPINGHMDPRMKLYISFYNDADSTIEIL